MRKQHDNYPTPLSIVRELARRCMVPGEPVWDPCAGDGRFADELRKVGCPVVSSEISMGKNFCDYRRTLAPTLVTNPPFKYIRLFIDHAFSVGATKMVLVCPERLWACRKGREQFERHRPSRFANMDWREDYLQKGGSPDRALAVAVWDTPHAKGCVYEVWSKSS